MPGREPGPTPSSGRRMSQKRRRAPCRANAVAVDVNVNDGTITTSPGPTPMSIAAISRASVHDVVSRTSAPWCTRRSRSTTSSVNGPFALLCPERIAASMFAISPPVRHGLLKGIVSGTGLG